MDTSTRAFLVSTVPLAGLATLQAGLPVLAPSLTAAMGLAPEAVGFISGAVGLGAVWLYMANAAFTTALGPVRALWIAALLGVGGALLVTTGTMALVLVGAVAIGFAYAVTTPAGSQILADHTPMALRGTFFSLRQAGVPAGGFVAGIAGSLVPLAGWRATLLAVTALCALSFWALRLAPVSFNESRPRPAFRFGRLVALSNLVQPFVIVREIPGLARMAAACIGFSVVQGTVQSFFVTFVATGLGMGAARAGVLFAIMQASSVAGRVVLGFVADRIGSPRPILKLLAFASAASALLLAHFTPDWPLPALVVASLAIGLSIATWNGLYLAEIASTSVERVGEATAGTTFFVFATYLVTPPLMSLLIARSGYAPAFVLAAACATLSGLILIAPWGRARL